jgi:hypothetical protein
MKKKHSLLLLMLLGLLVIGYWSVQVMPVATLEGRFQLSKGEYSGLSGEALRQDTDAVSIDENRNIYLLERKGWVVYRYSTKTGIQRVGLQGRPKPPTRGGNQSLAVNSRGNVWWCLFFSQGISMLRAYSHSGKVIQQWPMYSDVGYIQAVNDDSAYVDHGGTIAVYKLGSTSPRVIEDTASYPSYIDQRGTFWTLTKKSGLEIPPRYSMEIIDLAGSPKVQSNDSLARRTGTEIRGSQDMNASTIFWASRPSTLYLRERIRDFQGTSQFGSGLYVTDGHSIKMIARLKRVNEPLLQKFGSNIDVSAMLWGEGDSVVVYGVQKHPKYASDTPIHYIIRVASVPRWRIWLSL